MVGVVVIVAAVGVVVAVATAISVESSRFEMTLRA